MGKVGAMNNRGILFAAVLALVFISTPPARAETLAIWSFPDQGLQGNASTALAATTVDTHATAGSVVIGSAFTELWQNVGGTYYSYCDSTGVLPRYNNGSLVDSTGDRSWFVGDFWGGGGEWWDTTSTGIEGHNFTNVQNTGPQGSTGSGTGALYLASNPRNMSDLDEAISTNQFITFSVTADGGAGSSWVIDTFSFDAARAGAGSTDNNERGWKRWALQRSLDGSSYVDVYTATSDISMTGSFLSLTTGTFSSPIILNDGETATFRLAGYNPGSNNNTFRAMALDDLTLEGTFIVPEPPALLLVSVALLGLLPLARFRRRRSECRAKR